MCEFITGTNFLLLATLAVAADQVATPPLFAFAGVSIGQERAKVLEKAVAVKNVGGRGCDGVEATIKYGNRNFQVTVSFNGVSDNSKLAEYSIELSADEARRLEKAFLRTYGRPLVSYSDFKRWSASDRIAELHVVRTGWIGVSYYSSKLTCDAGDFRQTD